MFSFPSLNRLADQIVTLLKNRLALPSVSTEEDLPIPPVLDGSGNPIHCYHILQYEGGDDIATYDPTEQKWVQVCIRPSFMKGDNQ